MKTTDINPKLAEDIKNDMEELDKGKPQTKPAKSSMESQPCPDCANSLLGPGLLDAHTICPNCEGTGKVAVLN